MRTLFVLCTGGKPGDHGLKGLSTHRHCEETAVHVTRHDTATQKVYCMLAGGGRSSDDDHSGDGGSRQPGHKRRRATAPSPGPTSATLVPHCTPTSSPRSSCFPRVSALTRVSKHSPWHPTSLRWLENGACASLVSQNLATSPNHHLCPCPSSPPRTQAHAHLQEDFLLETSYWRPRSLFSDD